MNEELNLTLYQSFHWYTPADGQFWNQLTKQANTLKDLGINFIWLPPAYKACEGAPGVGYGVYDLFDLGEFDQKGSVRTKYGTKEEYVKCVQALQAQGLKVIVDVVLNHRAGGDELEKAWVEDVDHNDRTKKIGEPYEREVLSKFTFPGRKGKYSDFIWDFQSFTAINDHEDNKGNTLFYRILHEYNKGWDEVPSTEFGNFDYLLGADVEFRNPAVMNELKHWGEWYYDTVKFDGVRLDAVKHMNPHCINDWVEHVKKVAGKDMLVIAEDWTTSVEDLLKYKEMSEGKIQMFDVPLHYRFHAASIADSSYDMSKLLDNTLMQKCPELGITFVENHDTQPLQGLESPVDYWFQPLGYAIILLRKQSLPCVFSTSLFGAKYSDKGKDGQDHEVELVPPPSIREMMKVRKDFAYGEQRDYFDHPNTIGWTREGADNRPNSGCAIVLTNGGEGSKAMEIGKHHAGKKFVDALKHREDEIDINQDGWGQFPVNERSVSVWIPKI